MAEEGFEDRRKAGEERTQQRNLADLDDRPLEGAGSDERAARLRARFRTAQHEPSDRMQLSQLILIGIFVFLMVLLFGAGRYIIAAVAPKSPPGINAPR